MSSQERYSRQIRFAPLGAEGQEQLAASVAVIVGCGALGTIDFGLSLSIMRSVAKDTERFPQLERLRARADVAAANSVYALCGIATLAVTGLVVLWLPLLTKSARIGSGEDRLTILLVGVSIAIYLGTAAYDGIPAGRRSGSRWAYPPPRPSDWHAVPEAPRTKPTAP